MENEKYLNDLSEIKNLMNRSSRFLSLSGLSGILAGTYALIGAWLAYKTIYFNSSTMGSYKNLIISEEAVIHLIVIAVTVVALSLLTGILLSIQKAKKNKETIWNSTAKRLVINFLIPLASGGFFILFLIEKEMLVLIAPLTLLFYGLACVNASKYTLGGVRYLGITFILIGLLSTWFLEYGLLFWALGFGVCHILYGSIMYFRYERN
jgi:predicted lysophospholipase L1 biosynthesis ABC-type transport system permease subunit